MLLDYAGVITKSYTETSYPDELAGRFGISLADFLGVTQPNNAMRRLSAGDLQEEDVIDMVVAEHPDAHNLEPQDLISKNYDPDPAVLERLARIKEEGVAQLALVSNIFPASIKYIREKGVLDYFDYLFLSCKMRDRKPNESYFQAVLDECGVEPEVCMFLDDTVVNVEAAEEMGIPSTLVTDTEQVLHILDSMQRV